MSIADKLTLLINTKQDIKSAISEKGVEVTGGMTTYADAIRRIENGGWGSPFYVPVGLKFAWFRASTSVIYDVPIFTLPKLILADGYKDGSYMFDGNESLKSIDGIYSSNPSLVDCSHMFWHCKSLESILHLDTPKVTNMRSMFEECQSLISIPQLDTSNVTDMGHMFYNCRSLTSIPQLDTSNVTDMRNMFYYCESLTSIPQLDTSKVVDMSGMFWGCSSLTTIPHIYTTKVTDMRGMFAYCNSLITVPEMVPFEVTNTSQMFLNCINLKTIQPIYTYYVTDMRGMFFNCPKLESLPMLNCANATDVANMFGTSDSHNTRPYPNLTDLGGFQYLKVSLSGLDGMPNLTVQSLMNVINNLYDFVGNGSTTTRTLTLGTTNLNKLTAEQKAVATNKGWVLK